MNRYWEIDAARTLAIGMMVAYHLAWDLWWLTPDIDIDPFGGWLRALQVCTGSSFLFITGVSAALVHQRMVAAGVPMATRLRRHWRRALQVLAAGALVTVATFVALGSEDYVRFGILQCIGTVMLLLPLLARLGPVLNIAFAVPVILVGLQLRTAVSDVPGALIIAAMLMYLHTGCRPSKYLFAMLGQVAAGGATLDEVLPILRERERRSELDRQSRARRAAKKKVEGK